MAVYAKRVNGAQRSCMEKYENLCGFEFLYQDDIDAGSMGFKEAWEANIQWLEDMMSDVTNIQTNGACRFEA